MQNHALSNALENVRAGVPLVHCITNYVTVHDCANAVLACGGSPIMSDEARDVADIQTICGGLVLNIGTLNENTIEGMRVAAARADELGHPIVLDPVGAGASALRTATATELLDVHRIAVVRGNMSEVKALAAEDAGRLNVVGMTGLGLVELTRKKQRRPLSRQLMHTCSDCGGDGVVPSHETVARRAVREIWRRRRAGDGSPLLVETAPQVAGWLRRVGAPEGGPVYVCAVETLGEGEYRLSPADEAHLPGECKRLK